MMAHLYKLVLTGLLCFSCTGKAVTPEPEPDPQPEPVKERVLNAPGNLSLAESDGIVTLTWEDLSELEEGYLVRKKTLRDSRTQDIFLAANSTTWTDENVKEGQTVYYVASYWHTDRSPLAEVSYNSYKAPKVILFSLHTSWHMAAAGVKIEEDGGEKVDCGIICTRSGETEGKEITFAEKVQTDEVAYILCENLEPGTEYTITPWAENQGGRAYGEPGKTTLKSAPAPVTINWEDITDESAPKGLKVQKASTDALGHVVNMWCAIADMTQGTMELRTTISPKLVEPGNYVRETLSKEGNVAVLINGGYFDKSPMSYSYVCDRGTKKASNASAVTRTRGYAITRGFMGIDSSGKYAIGWTSGDSFYTEPLPVYDGGPILYPEGLLEQFTDWTPYSAIGGGPVLVKDGKYCFDYLQSKDGYYLSNHEMFATDIFTSSIRPPRTAIGYNEEGQLVILVADGRGSGGSTGLTLDEIARVMTGLGCTNVINLDGGGSSTFITGNEGTLHNKPSDGHERKVLSFVSLVEKNN